MEKMVGEITKLLNDNFKFTKEETASVERILKNDINYPRAKFICKWIVDSKFDKASVLAFLSYQLFKVEPELAEDIYKNLSKDVAKMVENFKTIKDINQLTASEEAEDVRRMFLVMGNDLRVVIIKLFGIYYDISVLNNPLNDSQKNFVKQVREIHVPLSERLGMDLLKQSLNDEVVRLEHPEEFERLKELVESKSEENKKQLEVTKEKFEKAILESGIKQFKINSRIKRISSIFNKIYNRKVSLDRIHDILAMRIIVDTVEECYEVLGRVHGLYKPMAGKVKDYIANPKPNGYRSLHTTIVVENQHPLEVQIRTKEMHRESEYGGVCAHWLYKEKKTKQDDFDLRMTWFRETIENAKMI